MQTIKVSELYKHRNALICIEDPTLAELLLKILEAVNWLGQVLPYQGTSKSFKQVQDLLRVQTKGGRAKLKSKIIFTNYHTLREEESFFKLFGLVVVLLPFGYDLLPTELLQVSNIHYFTKELSTVNMQEFLKRLNN